MKKSSFSFMTATVIAVGLVFGVFCASLVSCTKEEAVNTAVPVYPVFDLDKIQWAAMTEKDFEKEFIGFYRGNTEIGWVPTYMFKDEEGQLHDLGRIAAENELNQNRNDCNDDTCCEADFDDMGTVQVNDLLTFMGWYGTGPNQPCGDFTGDGYVNSSDYLIFGTCFGTGGYPGSC